MGEYDDPFGDSKPTRGSRRSGLLSGLTGHVSSAVSQHLNPQTQQRIVEAGKQIGAAGKEAGSRAIDATADWAASNPDKVEQIGGVVGGAVGGAATGGFFGRKVGAKAGKKLGGMLSRKAKERQGSPAPQSSAPADDDWTTLPSQRRKDLYT